MEGLTVEGVKNQAGWISPAPTASRFSITNMKAFGDFWELF